MFAGSDVMRKLTYHTQQAVCEAIAWRQCIDRIQGHPCKHSQMARN